MKECIISMIISTATQSMIAVLNTIRGFSAVSRPNNVFLPPQEFEHFHRIFDRMWEEIFNSLPKVVCFLRFVRFPPL